MYLKHGRARQPEIIKAVLKDSTYTTSLTQDLSDLLRLSGPRVWIRYNNLCKFFAEITYHGFSAITRLQTLGEEYTGIVQIDENYVSLPKKIIQLVAIILEFGGETLYINLLSKLEKNLRRSDELREEAKEVLLTIVCIMKESLPYITGLHKTWFYYYSGKYQISKRLLGINYVLVRNWLHENQPLYGFKFLSILSFLEITMSMVVNIIMYKRSIKLNQMQISSSKQNNCKKSSQMSSISLYDRNRGGTCLLCLEIRKNTSLTVCGHLFCWQCITGWLHEKEECPICREYIKKSNIVQLMNY